MNVRRRRLAGAAVLLFSLGAVACGPSPSPTPSSHPQSATPTATPSGSPPSTPLNSASPSASSNGTYTVAVTVSGTDTAQGSFTQSVDPSAASHCPPPNQLTGTVSGQRVQIQIPGALPPGTQQLSPGDLLLTVGSRTWGVASAANAPHATTGTLQRNADGSGSVQFQNLALQTNFAQQPQDSGSFTWTCA